MRQFDVLAVGELNPDLILAGIRADGPRLGTEQAFADYRLTLGSSTAIACVLMQRLGLRTAMVARIGDDGYGRFCLEALAAEGVATQGVETLAGVPTGLTISLPYPQDRMLLTCYGTMDRMGAEAVTDDMLANTRHIHSGSFFIQRRLRPGLADVFARARAMGVTTSLDTGWDPDGNWMTDDLQAVLAETDILFPNETEFAHLTGSEDIAAGTAALRALGVGEVVLKRGALGSVYAGPEGIIAHSGFPITPVDTTGAGDACNAGYLSARLRGLLPTERLALGNACGALTATAIGGTGGLKSLDQAMALVNG
jgi:ribokinase